MYIAHLILFINYKYSILINIIHTKSFILPSSKGYSILISYIINFIINNNYLILLIMKLFNKFIEFY
jgi:hypothetical protein